MFSYNEKTGMYECYDSGEGRMIPYEGKPFVSLSDELQEAAMRGEWCGACQASDCDHLIAGGVQYERPGHDLVNRTWWPQHEIEGPEEEEPEDPFEWFQYEGDRQHARTPRPVAGRYEVRPQRVPR